MATAIDIQGASKVYRSGGQSTLALHEVSLRIEPGELFFLLGPSGCGKTTLLRMIAGFLAPTAGQVLFNGNDVSHLPPNRRNTGMVFQSYALWPHMSVAANVGFGLGVRRVPGPERTSRVQEALRAVQMEAYAKRKPNQLSGGQQQRVALARALVIRPDVLLLDEPLSNLDARLRVELRQEIRTICKQYRGGITTVYVTHDQKEAMSMADRVALLRDGRVVQVANPETLYRKPTSRFAASFLGEANYIPCRILQQQAGRARVESAFGVFAVAADTTPQKRAVVAVRPESIRVVGEGARLEEWPLSIGKITAVTFLGDATQFDIEMGDRTRIRALSFGREATVRAEYPVRVWFDPADAILLDDDATDVTAEITPRAAIAV